MDMKGFRYGMLVVFFAAGATGCSVPARPALPSAVFPTPQFIRVGIAVAGTTAIRRVPLEEYVQATILSEFAPGSGDPVVVERMLEVQAVVSRTYVLAQLSRHGRDGFDVCATSHCQLFQPSRLKTSRWAPASDAAGRATSGLVLWYSGAPATALFHADCGGRTSNFVDVWGGRGAPYLVGNSDDGPASQAHASWRYEATFDTVRQALNADPRTRVGPRLDDIEVLDRDSAGRAERIRLQASQQRIVRGDALRDVLAHALGARTIRSTWFDVRREHGAYVFEGRGFGHGVGLCQAGALARIAAGENTSAVLSHYYPGTRLITLTRR
jgi:stage II sporulation protein D